MDKRIFLILLLISIVFVSGCISVSTGDEISRDSGFQEEKPSGKIDMTVELGETFVLPVGKTAAIPNKEFIIAYTMANNVSGETYVVPTIYINDVRTQAVFPDKRGICNLCERLGCEDDPRRYGYTITYDKKASEERRLDSINVTINKIREAELNTPMSINTFNIKQCENHMRLPNGNTLYFFGNNIGIYPQELCGDFARCAFKLKYTKPKVGETVTVGGYDLTLNDIDEQYGITITVS